MCIFVGNAAPVCTKKFYFTICQRTCAWVFFLCAQLLCTIVMTCFLLYKLKTLYIFSLSPSHLARVFARFFFFYDSMWIGECVCGILFCFCVIVVVVGFYFLNLQRSTISTRNIISRSSEFHAAFGKMNACSFRHIMHIRCHIAKLQSAKIDECKVV